MNNILTYNIEDSIALITLKMTDAPTNLFTIECIKTYVDAANKAIADPAVKGIILTSGHHDFMAGADLNAVLNPPYSPEELFKGLMEVHQAFRQLETAGKPFVAAINGSALGGGFELALSCHHRIAVNNPKIRIGLPEVQLGLLPGGGGTQRLGRMIGVPAAVVNILQAKQYKPEDALAMGFINAIVATQEELIPAAKAWILNGGKAIQPWDDRSFKIPGGGLMSKSGFETMIGGIGNLRKETHGNYPGAGYALAAIHDGIQIPIERGLEVEARYFTKAYFSKEARNIVRTGFFAMNEAKKGKAKPAGFEAYKINKLGILGAGMMGAGIAYVSALAGMQVVLKDVSKEAAEKGKKYSETLLQKSLSKGKISVEKMQAILGLIHCTADTSDLEACDLVIEAVFENQELKARVTKESEAYLEENKIFASNTSTIPITILAEASSRPANFIGIHFFSPVDKMPLVEIIVGKATSEYAIAAAIDYVTAIGKVPIVVNDSRGFFTSRVFGTYTGEGALLLQEGVPAALIENVAKRVGMPVGPLAVTDEVSLSLLLHVMDEAPEMSAEAQRVYSVNKILARELGREGKKVGKGFYEYPAGDKKYLWPGLNDIFKEDINAVDAETVGKRLLHIMSLESYRCLEENVLRSSKDGDLGSLLGLGFPPFTGGVFSYIDFVGIQNFVNDCDRFVEKFGPRFSVPDSLRKMAEEGRTFY
jgi:3-hydroxyacyl-CoA dehydrogenase / enoyl-CoA hydratase / 3-hydroxybutyryl-CoA epimerase